MKLKQSKNTERDGEPLTAQPVTVPAALSAEASSWHNLGNDALESAHSLWLRLARICVLFLLKALVSAWCRRHWPAHRRGTRRKLKLGKGRNQNSKAAGSGRKNAT